MTLKNKKALIEEINGEMKNFSENELRNNMKVLSSVPMIGINKRLRAAHCRELSRRGL